MKPEHQRISRARQLISSLAVVVLAGTLLPAAVAMARPVATPAAGSLDATFGSKGKVVTAFGRGTTRVFAVGIQPDGRIVIAGSFEANGLRDFAVARFTASGTLDKSFGNGGKVLTDFGSPYEGWNAIAIQPDGRIVVAGYSFADGSRDFALARYDSTGTLDTTFSADGKVLTDVTAGSDDGASSLAITTDGGIVVAGMTTTGGDGDFAVARYDSTGTLDPSFDGDGLAIAGFGGSAYDEANGLASLSDGSVIVVGQSSAQDANGDFAIARFGPTGALAWTTLTGLGGTSGQRAEGIAIDAAGRIVVAGNVDQDFALARYSPTDGSLDAGFGVDGTTRTDFPGSTGDTAKAIAIQADGKIVVVGYREFGTMDFAIARYDTTGTLDAGFDGDGTVVSNLTKGSDYAMAVALQGDGKVVAAGFTGGGSVVARYNVGTVVAPVAASMKAGTRTRAATKLTTRAARAPGGTSASPIIGRWPTPPGTSRRSS